MTPPDLRQSDGDEWTHPGSQPDADERHRLCWALRIFCVRRFADEVTRPHLRTMVTGEPFDVDSAFRERPDRQAA